MSESALITRHLVRHTHVVSIVGDILTVRARNIGLGDLAIVENWDGDQSLAQTVEVQGDEASLHCYTPAIQSIK